MVDTDMRDESQDNLSQPKLFDLQRLVSRPTKFADDFEPDSEILDMLSEDAKVLVVGAGGLGCEILKDLAYLNVKNITVIDLDKIDVTNLNRQFLFRQKDVNRYKAEVAAEVIMKRVPGVKIDFITDYVQNQSSDFYKQFHVIITGLDNVEARRWMNAMIHSLVTFDENDQPEEESQIALIDGGTEGFQGQARIIIPFKSGCYECSMSTLPPDTTYPLCTVKETPRLPEHCIQYAMVIEWQDHFERAIDKDSPEDMQWLCERAQVRANTFGIEGVNYKLTMGVVKNIIPAVASTNALVSAACCNEAFKILTGCNYRLDNYMQFMGQTRVSISTFIYQREDNCIVCSRKKLELQAQKTEKLKDFIARTCEQHKFKGPTIEGSKGYLCGTGLWAKGNEHKLELTFEQLVAEGHITGDQNEEFSLNDPNVPTQIITKIIMSDQL